MAKLHIATNTGKNKFSMCQVKFTNSFTIRWTSTARKIFSGLREKLFDQDDSTSLCHSKALTAMKR